MMISLEHFFQRKCIVSKISLKKKLMLKLKPNDKLENHFLEFGGIGHLLLSLNDDYDSVITAIETINNQKVNMEFTKSRLLDEEIKIGKQSSFKTVFQTSSIACYTCGQTGHRSVDCKSDTYSSNGYNRGYASRCNFSRKRSQSRANFRGFRGNGGKQGDYNSEAHQAIANKEVAFIALMCGYEIKNKFKFAY